MALIDTIEGDAAALQVAIQAAEGIRDTATSSSADLIAGASIVTGASAGMQSLLTAAGLDGNFITERAALDEAILTAARILSYTRAAIAALGGPAWPTPGARG